MDDRFPIGFVRHKVQVATRLDNGECGGSYGDAILILSSAISALAAELFRGAPDKKRFVQLWARYADRSLASTNISIPLLAQTLHREGDAASVRALASLRPEVFSAFPAAVDSLVLTVGMADASEDDVSQAIPHLSVQTIRRHSYPIVFYKHIRNGFVHEGDATEYGSSRPGGTRPVDISYANVINPPYRRIHFKIDWLGRVAESIARGSVEDVYKPREASPATWWAEGGAV